MIVEASSNKGDLVMDCFAGGGTTLGAAFACDRRWIGVDNSPESLKAILKRFKDGLELYGDYVKKDEYFQETLELEEKCPFKLYTTAQLSEIVMPMLIKDEMDNEKISAS